jgi:hypothetical protein
MLAMLIRAYRLIPFRPKCRCNHADGRSCSRRTLDLALAGGATLGIVAAAAAGCGNTSGGGSSPCMPNDPNNPNACQSAPPPPPANSDSFHVGSHTVSWKAL